MGRVPRNPQVGRRIPRRPASQAPRNDKGVCYAFGRPCSHRPAAHLSSTGETDASRWRSRPTATTERQEHRVNAMPARPVLTLVALASAALAVAAAYEAPRTFTGLRGAEARAGQGAALLGRPHGEDRRLPARLRHHHRLRAARGRGREHAAHAPPRGGLLAELDKVSKSEVFLKAAGTSVLNVGKGVASVVKDPKATAEGMGEGVKRFGTNLGRKAKRTTDKAVDSATSDEPKARAREVHGRQGRRDRRQRRELGARRERRRAQVGAEGRRRPVHLEPDPEEGARGHRPDRLRGRDGGQDRGADPADRERDGDRGQAGVGEGPRGAPEGERAEAQGHGGGRRRHQAALPQQGLHAHAAHGPRRQPAAR